MLHVQRPCKASDRIVSGSRHALSASSGPAQSSQHQACPALQAGKWPFFDIRHMGNLASCFGAGSGKEENKENESLLAESNGHHEPLQVRSIDVGVRGCFFWLSEHAERSMSMEERSTWMDATGKGECQDATLCAEAFNGLQGAALTGVFDGHGIQGRAAATAATEAILKHLRADSRAGPSSIPHDWESIFADACVQADQDMSKSTQMDSTYSGTTACMAMVHNGYVYAANVGDSGACLGRLGANGRIQGVELTKYAKPNDPQEARRIAKAGGKVLQLSNATGRRVGPHRVFNPEMTAPGLAMSRSLGDGYAHSLGVSAVPTCTAHKLTPADQFVVLATDGIWEVMTAQELVHFVHRWRKSPWQGWNASDALTLEAQERWKKLQPEIMVDDAAAIVIMLAPEPKQAAKILQAPAAACVASVSNGVANSIEAKAARDKLAALPYQNFFRHLQLERLDSSGRGMNEYANHKDDQDGPAPPNSGNPDSDSDPGARLRRALSRNTMLPQDIPSAAGSKPGAGSKINNASQGPAPGDSSMASNTAAAPAQWQNGDTSKKAPLPRPSAAQSSTSAPMSVSAFAQSFRSASAQPEQGSPPNASAIASLPPPPRSPLPSAFASPPPSPAGQFGGGQMWSPQPKHGHQPQGFSPFNSRQPAPWALLEASYAPLPLSLMGRANSSPSRLRMATLTIPENEISSEASRASPIGIAMLPPVRKAYPSRDSLNISPVASSPILDSLAESPETARSNSSESLLDRCQRISEEGRVRGGMSRMQSAQALLEEMSLQPPSLQPHTKLRSQSYKHFSRAAMGLRKTSADSLATMHRLEDCAFFSNPFSNSNPGPEAGKAANGHGVEETEQHSRHSSVDPWSYSKPVKRNDASMKGVQRGNSAAMDILRASPLELGLSHALSAPSTILKASLPRGSPMTILESRALLQADSCDSQGLAAHRQASSDHSVHSSSSCGGSSSSSAPVAQVADSAASMGLGGLKAEAGSNGLCRKLASDVPSMSSQSFLVEP